MCFNCNFLANRIRGVYGATNKVRLRGVKKKRERVLLITSSFSHIVSRCIGMI